LCNAVSWWDAAVVLGWTIIKVPDLVPAAHEERAENTVSAVGFEWHLLFGKDMDENKRLYFM